MNKVNLLYGLIPLILAYSATEAKAEEFLDRFFKSLRFGAGVGCVVPFKSPGKEYFDDLNDDFKEGKYTFETPIDGWRKIKTPSCNSLGIELSCLSDLNKLGVKLGKIKDPELGVVFRYMMSNPKSDYNESYDFWYEAEKLLVTRDFDRKESINVSVPSVGIKGKATLADDFDVSVAGTLDFYKTKGDVDYTMHRPDTNYTQWRKADYTGNGTGLSIEAGVNWNCSKNVSASLSGGYKWCNVETSGEEWGKATSGQTEWKKTKNNPYSPQFEFDSPFAKFDLIFKF